MSTSVEFIDMLLERVAVKEQAALESVQTPGKIRTSDDLLEEVEKEQVAALNHKIKSAMHKGLRDVCIPEREVPFGKLADIVTAGYRVRSTYSDHTQVSWDRPSHVQNSYKYF